MNKEKELTKVEGYIIGILSMFLGVFLGFLVGMNPGVNNIKNETYQQAYNDYKQDKIEKVVLEKYPRLWIKWNVEKGK